MQVLFCLFHNHSKNQWHLTAMTPDSVVLFTINPKMTPAIFIAHRTLHTHLISRAWMRQRRLINYSAAIRVTVIVPARSAGLMIAAGAGSCRESRVKLCLISDCNIMVLQKLWMEMETGSLNFINMHSCHSIAIDIFVLPSCLVLPASQRWRNFFFLTNA